MDTADIDNRFKFHPATTPEKQNLHSRIRAEMHDTALWVNEFLPDGREKSLAITHLEEAMFWANAAAARQDPKP